MRVVRAVLGMSCLDAGLGLLLLGLVLLPASLTRRSALLCCVLRGPLRAALPQQEPQLSACSARQAARPRHCPSFRGVGGEGRRGAEGSGAEGVVRQDAAIRRCLLIGYPCVHCVCRSKAKASGRALPAAWLARASGVGLLT